VETAVDDSRADASQNNETPSSRFFVSHPRKKTPTNQCQSTARSPPGGEQGGAAVRSVAALLTSQSELALLSNLHIWKEALLTISSHTF